LIKGQNKLKCLSLTCLSVFVRNVMENTIRVRHRKAIAFTSKQKNCQGQTRSLILPRVSEEERVKRVL